MEARVPFGEEPRFEVTLTNVSEAPLDVIGEARSANVLSPYVPCASCKITDREGHYFIRSLDRPSPDTRAVRIMPGQAWSFVLPPSDRAEKTPAAGSSEELPSLSALLPGEYTGEVVYFIRDAEKEQYGGKLAYGPESGSLAGQKPKQLWEGVVRALPVKFEVLDDGSKELAMLRAVHAGKGREHLRLELKREEETVDGGLRIALQLCARNTGKEPLYLGSDYGLICVEPGGEKVPNFSGPRSGTVTVVSPGEVKELGGWGWSSEGKKPGRHTVWVQYVAPKTRELIAESNRLTFDVPTPVTQADAKSISELIRELQGGDHDLAQAAMYALADRGKPAVAALVAIVEDHDAPARNLAVISLGIAKHPDTVPLLIQCLDDANSEVRGRAAFALSQIGGDQARDALVAFLDKCLANEDHSINLTKATESLKELPDARALPSLMRVTDEAGRAKKPGTRMPYAARYAAIALGKIGDPRAAKSLAALLDPSMTYDGSTDRFVLEAIHDTKGKDALGPLVAYLKAVVLKMKGQPELPADWTMNSPVVQDALSGLGKGAESRQELHNTCVYVVTIACLETITGRKSQGSARKEVLEYWQDTVAKWNQDETSTAIKRPDGSSGSHTAASTIHKGLE